MTARVDPGSNAPFNMARYSLGLSAAKTPDKAALIVIDDAETCLAAETWTYAHLEDAVLRVAAALQDRGYHKGDRILIRLNNTSTYPITYFGTIAAGLIALPASSQLTAAEAELLLADSGARAIALADGLPRGAIPADVDVLGETQLRAMMTYPRRAEYAATVRDDPAYLIYTSGTTARPKGVLHAHRVALGRAPMYQGWYGISDADRVLHAGAFNWTYTLGTGLIDPWANGATTIIFTGEKSPEIWPQLISKTGATLFAAVPSLMRQILKYAPPGPLALGHLRHGLIAGERPPEDLFDTWFARTGTHLYEALGMSEISTYVSTCPTVPRKPGATGKPQAGRRVAILPLDGGTEPLPAGSEGLVAVHRSDPGLMLQYWNRPEEDAEVRRGDWFIGGDIGVMDEDGYLTHLGRANDVMNAFGYRVSPQEVEATLAQFPGVAEVACAEVNMRADVSVIAAFVVAAPGHGIDTDKVKAFATERLAAYKCPREVFIVDSLPHTANGKVKRNALKVPAA
jgi:acetyl-CoA synthetase